MAGAPRPEGWQIGVGPGAVLLSGLPPGGVADGFAERLAGTTDCSRPGSHCPVLGHGRIAGRLRAALGEIDPARDDGTGLLVLVQQHVVAPEASLLAVRRSGPTLPVVVQARRVIVGPVSGLDGPCLHCLDLQRRDLDPHWPQLLEVWGHPAVQADPVQLPPAVEEAATGLTLILATSVLAGRCPQRGMAHEIGPEPPHVVARRWSRHPACRWHPSG
ncbi:hypothetical protein [Ornithinimicrobium panacihumi]|uniref:hypothetical protein n=1 Tax=Ornithinimicrobium panacihumi TaxID=2008449 RepID=UPI003F8AD6DB